jgi:hypothetical protein
MKHFKLTELLIYAVILVCFPLLMLISSSFELFFPAYFITGALQLFSIIIHFINGWFIHNPWRRGYALFLLLLFLLLLFVPMYILWMLLYSAPLLAAFYVYICYREWKILQFKEFIHLK